MLTFNFQAPNLNLDRFRQKRRKRPVYFLLSVLEWVHGAAARCGCGCALRIAAAGCRSNLEIRTVKNNTMRISIPRASPLPIRICSSLLEQVLSYTSSVQFAHSASLHYSAAPLPLYRRAHRAQLTLPSVLSSVTPAPPLPARGAHSPSCDECTTGPQGCFQPWQHPQPVPQVQGTNEMGAKNSTFLYSLHPKPHPFKLI